MYALSIKNPWAWLILHPPFKDVENRTWPTFIRGRFLVHAGKSMDVMAFARLQQLLTAEQYRELALAMRAAAISGEMGAVLGEVTLEDCVESHSSIWFEGPFGFVLKDPQAYEKPLPHRGQLGFFDIRVARESGAPA